MKNIGFLENQEADYFCFHDVDMYPTDNVDYSYTDMPTHLAYAVEQFDYELPYRTFMGGVTLFDKASYLQVNGYSNAYVGWSTDDDDLFIRCIDTTGVKRRHGRFWSEDHDRTNYEEWQKTNADLMFANIENLRDSGVSNCEYNIIEVKRFNPQLRRILVSI